MALVYKHSEVMTSVKTIKETITDNFSSNQYIELLDELFYNALAPIILHTSHADSVIAACLHNASLNSRRKISAVDKDHLLSLMSLYLAVPRERKIAVLKQMRLERTILRFIIKSWLELLKPYEELYARKDAPAVLRREYIKRSIGFSESVDLFSTIQTVKYWNERCAQYKTRIQEKYFRFVAGQAQAFYKHNNSKMELDDVIQTMSMFASRAIDKFDTSCGTLTSYITNWLTHAKSVSAQQELGTAFTLPTGKRNEVKNAYVSIDSEEVQEIEHEDNVEYNVERMSEIERIRFIAKCMDPKGFGRVSLNIAEVLTEEELALQRKYAVA